MQIRSPYHLNSSVSGLVWSFGFERGFFGGLLGVFCVPGMVFITQRVVAVKLCLNFFVSPLLEIPSCTHEPTNLPKHRVMASSECSLWEEGINEFLGPDFAGFHPLQEPPLLQRQGERLGTSKAPLR